MRSTKNADAMAPSKESGDFHAKLAKRPRIALSHVEHPALVSILSGVSRNAIARTIAALAELGARQSLGIVATQGQSSPVAPMAASSLLQVQPRAASAGVERSTSHTYGEVPAIKPAMPASKMSDALGIYDQ